MLWSPNAQFIEEPFELEADLEEAVRAVAPILIGETRIYLHAKKKIGGKGKIKNIPDGYLVDLSSAKEPKLYERQWSLIRQHQLRRLIPPRGCSLSRS